MRTRHHTRPSSFLLALLATAALSAAAAPRQEPPLRTARAERIDAEITIDGRLDEPVWAALEPLTGFLQRDPDEGQPVSEHTEVFVFYDAHKIYFGFRCYDSEPHRIIARLGTHDARTNSDSVEIFLDPFGDRRTGYYFSVNARGIQFDALLTEAGGMDSTWDGIWESAARLEDWGWSAEVAIPFNTIRFAAGRPWGVNFGRDIVRKNERAFWQFVTRYDGRMRPSKAGILEGLEGIEPGLNLELVPYVSGRMRRGAPEAADDVARLEGGLDIRWGPLPFLTASLAIHPDFAETEADEFNISISRFELFFPEKRAFFNEGANFFDTPMNLFFTRRVGARLPDGRPQRIRLGAKLAGKVNDWSLGLLEARTEEMRFTDPATRQQRTAPAANFLVARVQRDIWQHSSLGFFTANRDQAPGDIGSTQRVHAVDLGVVRGPHLRWNTQLAYSQNEADRGDGLQRVAFLSDLRHSSDVFGAVVGYKYLGRGVDLSALGFEPQIDRHATWTWLEWRPFVDRGGVRQYFFGLEHGASVNTAGLIEDDSAQASVGIRFQNFWFLRVRAYHERVRFFEFDSDFQRGAGARLYNTPRLWTNLTTDPSRFWNLRYDYTWRKFVQFRENFHGRGEVHGLTFGVRMFGRSRAEFNGQVIREFLMDGTPFQVRRLFITRVNHQFTRQLRMRVLAQTANDRHGEVFSVNSIVAYDFTARSAAIAGYNYHRSAPARPRDLGNEFFFKLSYLFRF